MANIMDYLNWRGELSFSQDGLNEIDSLILSNISYVALDRIVPSPWEPDTILLKDAIRQFWEGQEEQEQLKRCSLIKMAPFIMRRLAQTKRFGTLSLAGYQNSVCKEEESQFSAVCIELGPQQTYVAFRGTDDTLIGWKENFCMCFETVPAQRKAADYLNYIGRKYTGELWLGGHSKGGNLAVYSAAKAKPELQKRIKGIYNFDGPGFSRRMLASVGYQQIAGRIYKYVPVSSIIGMLLEQDENYQIVSSEEQGLRQHDPASWRVLGSRFVSVPRQDKEIRWLNHIMHQFIYHLSLEERKNFVNTLFQVMEESDIHTVDDFGGEFRRTRLRRIRQEMRKSPACQQVLKQAGHQMLAEVKRGLTGLIHP